MSNKAQEVLRRIGLGLQNNPSLTLEDLLVYIYHTLKDLQPHLKDNSSKDTEYVIKNIAGSMSNMFYEFLIAVNALFKFMIIEILSCVQMMKKY